MTSDSDGDGIADLNDNCPNLSNPNQADLDSDRIGDACDSDRDGDSVSDVVDNCPETGNTGQSDLDLDGLGDPCDQDSDADGRDNISDNCPATSNFDQADGDHDGIGDVCDSDRDGDGAANLGDNCPDAANTGQADWDHDGQGDACDPDQPAAGQMTALLTQLDTTTLPAGLKSSLSAKLAGALADFNAGKHSACNKLASFNQEVAAQTGKKIPTALAATLNAQIDAILTAASCE